MELLCFDVLSICNNEIIIQITLNLDVSYKLLYCFIYICFYCKEFKQLNKERFLI